MLSQMDVARGQTERQLNNSRIRPWSLERGLTAARERPQACEDHVGMIPKQPRLCLLFGGLTQPPMGNYVKLMGRARNHRRRR